jgi:hypothetical protein
LIFNKDAQSMHWRKGSLFHKWCWENWISETRYQSLTLYYLQFKVN